MNSADTLSHRSREVHDHAQQRESVGDFEAAASIYETAWEALRPSATFRGQISEYFPEQFQYLLGRRTAALDKARSQKYRYRVVSHTRDGARNEGAPEGATLAVVEEEIGKARPQYYEDRLKPLGWFSDLVTAREFVDEQYRAQLAETQG